VQRLDYSKRIAEFYEGRKLLFMQCILADVNENKRIVISIEPEKGVRIQVGDEHIDIHPYLARETAQVLEQFADRVEQIRSSAG